jgi:hypothetical protein
LFPELGNHAIAAGLRKLHVPVDRKHASAVLALDGLWMPPSDQLALDANDGFASVLGLHRQDETMRPIGFSPTDEDADRDPEVTRGCVSTRWHRTPQVSPPASHQIQQALVGLSVVGKNKGFELGHGG